VLADGSHARGARGDKAQGRYEVTIVERISVRAPVPNVAALDSPLAHTSLQLAGVTAQDPALVN
jgi:hypothetical protein